MHMNLAATALADSTSAVSVFESPGFHLLRPKSINTIPDSSELDLFDALRRTSNIYLQATILPVLKS